MATGDFGAVLDSQVVSGGTGWVIETCCAHVYGNIFIVTYRQSIAGVKRLQVESISIDFTTGAVTTITTQGLEMYLQGRQDLITLAPNYFAAVFGGTGGGPPGNTGMLVDRKSVV